VPYILGTAPALHALAGSARPAAGVFVGIGQALPVAIGIAILKHRLYAIDKIISRTVSYALVTGLVVGAYLGFNRARYDADQTVAAFAARLRDSVDLAAVQHDQRPRLMHAINGE
jgi:RNase H-fold protein (predicted Holliday junction resolvase)